MTTLKKPVEFPSRRSEIDHSGLVGQGVGLVGPVVMINGLGGNFLDSYQCSVVKNYHRLRAGDIPKS